MNKNYLLSFAIIILISVGLVSATLNVSLSDQGTEVTNTTSGALLTLGDLTVLIYDALTGGNLIYNETFSGAIGNGSWNVMLGEITNLPLEFGKKYFKDYLIAGEDASFVNGTGQTVARQFFYSPLGDINSSKLFGIIKVLGSKVGIGTSTPSSTLEVNGTLGLSSFASLGSDTGYMFKNINGTLYWNATTISAAFNGSSNSTNGTLGLVLAPQSGEQGQCLKGDGTWGACGSDFVCPTGFTMIETNGFQMGCMQNTKEGTSTVCQTAVLDCYDTYGGRLPQYSEIYTAVQRYGSSLTDEGTATEWLDEAQFDGGSGGASYSCGKIDTSANSYRPFGALYTSSADYRCFIPPGGGGGASGGSFYGSLKWDETTDCLWTTTSSTFANVGSDAECDDTARTARGLTTSVTTAANAEGQIPQIKFDSLPAGYYFVRATGFYYSSSSESCYWRFTNGSQNTVSNTIGGGAQFAAGGTVEGEFFFASDQGATTLTLQAARQSANTCELSVATGDGDREFEIAVYYFPSFGTAKSDTIFSDLDGDTRINVDGDGSDSDNMTFFTAGTERMVIKNDGKVGIGTSSPTKDLDVQGSESATAIASFENTNTGSNADGIVITLGQANAGSTNNFITFRDNAGGSVVGSIEGAGTNTVAYQTSSDARMKDNVRETKYGLNDLMSIQVRDYEVDGVTATGFVAQELYIAYPEIVSVGSQGELNMGDPDNVWSVEYGKLTPLLTKAIQEQQSQIELLQSQNDLLKSELCSRDSSYSWCKNSLFSIFSY